MMGAWRCQMGRKGCANNCGGLRFLGYVGTADFALSKITVPFLKCQLEP